jgi:hypothetical protein
MSAHHDGHSHESDVKAGFLGLVLGFLAVFVIVASTALVTHAVHSRAPAAEAPRQ